MCTIMNDNVKNSQLSVDEVSKLFNDFSVVRKDLSNIKKELSRLNFCFKRDIENVFSVLNLWQYENCPHKDTIPSLMKPKMYSAVSYEPIGLISSVFPAKRGIPRQSGICDIQGKIVLFNSVFTNPNHALQGLEDFSHMWILFHFHKNESTHVRAKVAPPRLNGIKTGVFSTRTPHRPSPIGLSLVRIDRIENSSIYFTGVDMLDGTPVLDIKPYIPQYDNPSSFRTESEINYHSVCTNSNNDEKLDDEDDIQREAPDGEECVSSNSSQVVSFPTHSFNEIRVPKWISDQKINQLDVTFNEKAQSFLNSLRENIEHKNAEDVKDLESSIVKVLKEDPRSVYVRKQYSNQFYTFLIGNFHVSCKFDDVKHSVNVYKIVKADSVTK